MPEFLTDLTLLSSFTAVALFLWFQTNAFLEYLRIFDSIAKVVTKEKSDIIADFDKQHELSPSIMFADYLNLKYDNFFGKLFSCPICLGVWINLVATVAFFPIGYFFPSLIISYFLYFRLVKTTNDN